MLQISIKLQLWERLRGEVLAAVKEHKQEHKEVLILWLTDQGKSPPGSSTEARAW